MNILERIVADRRRDLNRGWYNSYETVPETRIHPLVPFGKDPFLVCEIKRKSPSKGDIRVSLDPVIQAGIYRDAGISSVSVLTETNYFSGSLEDLQAIKDKFPELSVLRKDFLLSLDDIRVSYRAGADAVLLIASILEEEEIRGMYDCAKQLGMDTLVEVHTREDVEKVASFTPDLIGINSRDLTRFTIDLCHPLKIKNEITWNPRLVFESGISSKESAAFALSSGFRGLLVGEAVVKNPALIWELKESFAEVRSGSFWEKLYGRKRPGQETGGKPLVKICGLTRIEDISLADSLGADILGFILAPSPRRVSPDFIRAVPPTRALKAGIVVLEPEEPLPLEASRLLGEGYLDVIQFHGDEEPEACFDLAFPYYKALRIRDEKDVDSIDRYRCPRVLLDAFSPSSKGGTGKQIDEMLVKKALKKRPLWLAGGIHPGNIGDLIDRYSPELVDVSSGLEASPGIKDRNKVISFFKELEHVR